MDRFLLFATKPIFHKTTTLREHQAQLKESALQDFVLVFERIFESHKTGKNYILSEEALEAYDEMVDRYAEFITEKIWIRRRY